jgi:hypothetical protein
VAEPGAAIGQGGVGVDLAFQGPAPGVVEQAEGVIQ